MTKCFAVVVLGQNLWISVDDEIQCVRFRVTRVLEAADADTAAARAILLVRQDPKTQPLPGYAPPTLSIGEVTPAAFVPPQQPGFALYPAPPPGH